MNKTITVIFHNAGVHDKAWIKFLKPWILISLAVLMVTAFFTDGIYHPDEYFQTIEFANYKLGNTDSSRLAWEFPARMRPWLQPFCYYVLTRIFTFMGVTDPFTLVMIFRLFSALFAWIMITTMMFSAYCLYGNDSQRKAVVYILALLPFLPYMFVRTSSESPSSSFSMAAFGLLMLGSSPSLPDDYGYKRNYSMGLLFAAGILFGIAFEFRYQSAFLTAGFIFWLFFISIHPKKKAIAGIAVLILGILIPVVLCTFLDSWGYGKFTIAPWNYLYQNIVLDKSSGFGTLPFYGYIGLILSRPFRRLTFFIILLAGTVLGIARNPKHPLSWAVLMFFITHSLVAHKELRFLMNILVPAIFLTVYGFYSKNGGSILSKVWNFRTSIPAKLVYMFSILVSFTYLGAADRSDADIQFCKYLYRNLNTPCTIYAVNYSPFAPWSNNLEYNFYKPKGLEVVYVASIDKSLVDNIGGGGAFWL